MKTPPPLSPELEALLAPHRAILPLHPAVEARVVARAAALGESRERAGARTFFLSRWAFAVAAGAVLAFGVGAYAAYAWRVAPPSRAVVHRAPIVAMEADEPAPAVPSAGAPGESETATTIAPAAAPHPKRRLASASRPSVPTNAELQLLRAARQDVTRGDFAGALTAIAEHAHRFRNGALVEEREALRVKSLAGLGRNEDAQRAAAQFHARFPHSVLLSTFERMRETDR